MFILGLVGRIVNDVTGQSQRDQNRLAVAYANNPRPVLAPVSCACRGRRYCAQCAYAPAASAYPYDDYGYYDQTPYLSRRDVRRGHRHELRALRDARRAARRGYGYPVVVPVPAGCAGPTTVGNGYGGCARDLRYDGGEWEEAMAGSSSRTAGRWVPPEQRRRQDQSARRASFDAGQLRRSGSESEEDLPPQYERGNWQPPMRKSAEALTAEGK